MSDDIDADLTAWAEQPVNSSGDLVEETKDEGAPEGSVDDTVAGGVLTPELRKELDERDARVLAQAQSTTDKAEQRITDNLRSEFSELDRSVAAMKKAGIEVDEAGIKELKQTRVLEEISGGAVDEESSEADPAKDLKPGAPKPPDPPQSPVLATAYAMMAEAKTYIEKDDAEKELIDFKTKSVKVFLDSVQTAIDTKQKRLSGASEDDEVGKEEDTSESEDDETDAEKKAADAAARNPSTGVKKGKVTAGSREGVDGFDLIKRGYKKGPDKT